MDELLTMVRQQQRMALLAPDGTLQRCTIGVVTDSQVAVLFDSCSAAKFSKDTFLQHLLSVFGDASMLADVSSTGALLCTGFLTDATDVPHKGRVVHTIMARNGTRQPGAYLFGHGCRMGNDGSMLVMSASKSTPNVSPALFGGDIFEGCSVRIPGQEDTFIFVCFISGHSGQWRNVAVVGVADDEALLFLVKVTSEQGELTFVSSDSMSKERLAAMKAALPTFLADCTPDSVFCKTRAPPRRSARVPKPPEPPPPPQPPPQPKSPEHNRSPTSTPQQKNPNPEDLASWGPAKLRASRVSDLHLSERCRSLQLSDVGSREELIKKLLKWKRQAEDNDNVSIAASSVLGSDAEQDAALEIERTRVKELERQLAAAKRDARPRQPPTVLLSPGAATTDAATRSTAATALTAAAHAQSQDISPPGSVRLIRKQLRGLRAAQGVERTAGREKQIGELEFDLEERERKYRKAGHW